MIDDSDRGDGAGPGQPKPEIAVSHADSKQLLAILAHINQLARAASKDNRFLRPVEMDPTELLLAAASLRALFFDDTPRPMLLGFLEDHGLSFDIEAIETNLGLILLSQLLPEDGHISDELAGCILDPEHHERMPLEKKVQVMAFHTDARGLESMMKRPDLWAPSREEDVAINSGLTPYMGEGPGQLIDLRRTRVPLKDWGRVRLGFLKTIPIDRKNIISYVANKLGGVHYDSKRRPADTNDATQFKALATGYDWDDQALMHAGFVAVGLACIEVLYTREIVALRNDFARFHAMRQSRLTKALEEALAKDPPPRRQPQGRDNLAGKRPRPAPES